MTEIGRVKIERFDVSKVPDHGRPRVVEFTAPEGTLGLHVSREDGSLWLFADGPRGGSRGSVAFRMSMAERMLAWLDGDCRNAAPSTTGALWLDPLKNDARYVVMRASAMSLSTEWKMSLDDNALDELKTAFRQWATLVSSRGAMSVHA